MLKINFDSTDISRQQARYEYQASTVAFDGTKKLLVGFKKPISNLYLNLIPNSATRELTVEYFNGSSWSGVQGLVDLTFGLTESGFVHWYKNQATEAKTTLEGESLYWYRFSIPEATITFKGINTLFSDDFDLKGEFPTIMDHLPEGKDSFVTFHESARKAIVTDLRKTGVTIQGFSDEFRKQLDAFDLLDIEEVRESAKFLALSKIFKWLSDSAGDKWDALGNEFAAEAAGALTPIISIDQDNDGLADEDEVASDTPGVVLVGRL